MAFADFLDLQTAVVEQVRNPGIADVMPRLVLLAEATFNQRLRCRDQMASQALTISNGEAALPVDFLEAIGLFDTQGAEYIQQPVHALKDGRNRGHYAISGADLLCNSDGAKQLEYYASIPTLTASLTTTNWLLAKFPAVYLYGVGAEAAKYLRDPEGAQLATNLLEAELRRAGIADQSARYSRATVRLQGVTP